MDDALVHSSSPWKRNNKIRVLILVVMDDALVPVSVQLIKKQKDES